MTTSTDTIEQRAELLARTLDKLAEDALVYANKTKYDDIARESRAESYALKQAADWIRRDILGIEPGGPAGGYAPDHLAAGEEPGR